MENLVTISVAQAHHYLQHGDALLVDIRDAASFHAAHAPTALHLTNATMATFMQQTELTTPVMVMCYHGISSRSAAEYLLSQGFTTVYSIDGGFAAWAQSYPQETHPLFDTQHKSS